MKRKKLRITEMDYLKANRKASRQEEIESHGHPVQGRAMIHKSKKVYDRNRMKRAAIKSDDSSHFFCQKSVVFTKCLWCFCYIYNVSLSIEKLIR